MGQGDTWGDEAPKKKKQETRSFMDPQEVTVTWGAETFRPVPYYSFTVGPFTTTTVQRFGEKVEDTVKRAHKALSEHADLIFAAKRNAFIERYKALQDTVKKEKLV